MDECVGVVDTAFGEIELRGTMRVRAAGYEDRLRREDDRRPSRVLNLHGVRVDEGRVARHDINIVVIEVAHDPALVVSHKPMFLPQEVSNGVPILDVDVDTPKSACPKAG